METKTETPSLHERVAIIRARREIVREFVKTHSIGKILSDLQIISGEIKPDLDLSRAEDNQLWDEYFNRLTSAVIKAGKLGI